MANPVNPNLDEAIVGADIADDTLDSTTAERVFADGAIPAAKVATAVASDGGLTIYNDTGGTLTAGTLVTVDSYDSTNGVTVVAADADNDVTATHVVLADISNATTGDVYARGVVTGLNTGGLTIGDKLYLSATAGEYSTSALTGAGQLSQLVGVVKVVDASDGEVEFFPGLGIVLAIGDGSFQSQAVGVNSLHNDARMNSVVVSLEALPAPTNSDQLNIDLFAFQAPSNSEITGAALISNTTTSSSDETSEYTFEIYNQSAAESLSSAVTKTSTTEITADTPYVLTVDQNTQIDQGEVLTLRVDIEDDGTPNPTDLSSADLKLQLNYRVRA